MGADMRAMGAARVTLQRAFDGPRRPLGRLPLPGRRPGCLQPPACRGHRKAEAEAALGAAAAYSGSTSSAVECRSGGICFQSGSDVDVLAMDIVAIDHDIAEVDTDATTATSGSSA